MGNTRSSETRPHRVRQLCGLVGKHCDAVPCGTCGGLWAYWGEVHEFFQRVDDPAGRLKQLSVDDVKRLNRLSLRRLVELLTRVEDSKRDGVLAEWANGPVRVKGFAEELLRKHSAEVSRAPGLMEVLADTLLPAAFERTEEARSLRDLLEMQLPERLRATPEFVELRAKDRQYYKLAAQEFTRLEAERRRVAEEAAARKAEVEKRALELRSMLAPLSLKERLLKLLESDDASIAVWPGEMTEASNEELFSISPELRVGLLRRLRDKKKGALHRLKGRLHVLQKEFRDKQRDKSGQPEQTE